MTNYQKTFDITKHLYFAMDDKNPLGTIPISFDEAAGYNIDKYGIYHTVNSFNNGKRTKENLKEILFWAIDIDKRTKTAQISTIRRGLRPTYVVSTKSGLHAYFRALNATSDNHALIQTSLVDYYGADKNAKDITRILRVPGYNHWKGDKPYLCHEIYQSDAVYTEQEILIWLASKRIEKTRLEKHCKKYTEAGVYDPKVLITEGNRNCFLNRYGYILKNLNGLSMDEVEERVFNFNSTRINPPLSEREVQSILTSLGR
jgi:hypothetical protein